MLTTLTGKTSFSRLIVAALRLAESAVATGILCVFASAATHGTFSTPLATPSLQPTAAIAMVQK